MPDLITQHWPAALGITVLVLALAIWLLTRSKAPRERKASEDVLSEGAAPATRNTALIDAPSAASLAAAPPPPVAEPVAAPSPVAAPAPALADPGDDLSRIKGLGPKLRARLAELGITRFAQIAALTDADLTALDAQLGAFAGRPRKDNWVAQARYLADDDLEGYEAKFGKI